MMKSKDNMDSVDGEGYERESGLKRDDAYDHEKWKKLPWETTGQPLHKHEKRSIFVAEYSLVLFAGIDNLLSYIF